MNVYVIISFTSTIPFILTSTYTPVLTRVISAVGVSGVIVGSFVKSPSISLSSSIGFAESDTSDNGSPEPSSVAFTIALLVTPPKLILG